MRIKISTGVYILEYTGSVDPEHKELTVRDDVEKSVYCIETDYSDYKVCRAIVCTLGFLELHPHYQPRADTLMEMITEAIEGLEGKREK
jgi:hypothetical protein